MKRFSLSRPLFRCVVLLVPVVQVAAIAACFTLLSQSSHPLVGAWAYVVLGVASLACVIADVCVFDMGWASKPGSDVGRTCGFQEHVTMQNAGCEQLESERKRAEEIRSGILGELRLMREHAAGGQVHGGSLALGNVACGISAQERFCGHAEVNALLEIKRAECEECDVRFIADVSIPRDLSICTVDICSAFSNLLDNALQAASFAEGENRFVDVRARCMKGFLSIAVQNGLANEHPDDTHGGRVGHGASSNSSAFGTPVRRRIDDRGWGTSILQDFADRYNGRFASRREGDCWVASVIVELPEK